MFCERCFLGSTSNEVRGARQPTSVVLKLGAPNQCSVVPSRRGYTDTQDAQISALFCVIPRLSFPTPPSRGRNPVFAHRHARRTNFRVILRYSAAFVSHSALHGKKPRVRHEPNARRLPVHARAKTVLRTSDWDGKMEDRCVFHWRFGSHAQRKAHGLKSRLSLRQIFHQRPSKGPRLSRSFALPKGRGSAGASPSQTPRLSRSFALPKGLHRHARRTNFRVILRYSAAFVSHPALPNAAAQQELPPPKGHCDPYKAAVCCSCLHPTPPAPTPPPCPTAPASDSCSRASSSARHCRIPAAPMTQKTSISAAPSNPSCSSTATTATPTAPAAWNPA